MAYTIRKFKHVTLHTKGRGRATPQHVIGVLVTSERTRSHSVSLPCHFWVCISLYSWHLDTSHLNVTNYIERKRMFLPVEEGFLRREETLPRRLLPQLPTSLTGVTSPAHAYRDQNDHLGPIRICLWELGPEPASPGTEGHTE